MAGKGGPNGGNAADAGNGQDDTDKAASAADPSKQADTCAAGHPVDVATGCAFTFPFVDFELPEPLPFVFERVASSHQGFVAGAARRDRFIERDSRLDNLRPDPAEDGRGHLWE